MKIAVAAMKFCEVKGEIVVLMMSGGGRGGFGGASFHTHSADR